jgi:hypothetical protein
MQQRRIGGVEQRQRELLAQLEQDLVLAAKVVVDRALADARRGGDVVQRGARRCRGGRSRRGPRRRWLRA